MRLVCPKIILQRPNLPSRFCSHGTCKSPSIHHLYQNHCHCTAIKSIVLKTRKIDKHQACYFAGKLLIIWGSEFSSYEADLRKMTSHFELLTRKFSQKLFFRVTNSTSSNNKLNFELITCRFNFFFLLSSY